MKRHPVRDAVSVNTNGVSQAAQLRVKLPGARSENMCEPSGHTY
jgi:hypothetical protein